MNRWRILSGDVRERLADVDDASVQTCITSPPYWGLRDYGHDEQIGLEKTPDAYVAEMAAVFREVRRVLKDDGTLWLNLGDSYAANGGAHGGRDDNQTGVGAKRAHVANAADQAPRQASYGLKPKDLVGIPWRVAFALQADGWWLRQDIIWSKPNPMPESVTDRCTKAHEYLFLLTKRERYYYDSEAIKEPLAESSVPRLSQNIDAQVGTTRANGGAKTNGNFKASGNIQTGLRNKRSVWTVTTQPYSGAHFAVMPEALVEPCVLAGSRADDVVLDPFTGSGTVGAVALRLGRSFVGCELNPAYVALAEQRLRSVAPLFALEGA